MVKRGQSLSTCSVIYPGQHMQKCIARENSQRPLQFFDPRRECAFIQGAERFVGKLAAGSYEIIGDPWCTDPFLEASLALDKVMSHTLRARAQPILGSQWGAVEPGRTGRLGRAVEAWGDSWMPRNGPKSPQMAQNDPRMAQNDPKMAPKLPKMTPKWPKWPL